MTRNFPPLVGGMEKFNFRAFAEIARTCDVAICGPAGCARHVPAGCTVVEVGGRNLGLFLFRLGIAALRLARTFRPDVVLAGSGLTAPIALMAARSCGAKYALFVYGLDLVVRNAIYQRLWMPAIRKADKIFPISEYTRLAAIERHLDPARMCIITPGVDITAQDPAAAARFRESLSLQSKPILLSVGRLTNRKGIAEFVEQALPAVVERFPGVVLVVIGGEPSDALAGNRGGSMARVRETAAKRGISRNVLLLGRCEDDVVSAAYQASDVHVFPVIEIPGDVEGFGMVALEAAAGGLPTVAFKVGGIPDAVSDGISGKLLAPGDYAGFVNAVNEYLSTPADRPAQRAACIAHARAFDWQLIGRRLAAALQSEMRDIASWA